MSTTQGSPGQTHTDVILFASWRELAAILAIVLLVFWSLWLRRRRG